MPVPAYEGGQGDREVTPPPRSLATSIVVGYVVLALTVDTLAAHRVHFIVDWSMFAWRGNNSGTVWNAFVSGIDWFKLIFWFIVPLAVCVRGLDWGAFGVQRWTKSDLVLLGGMLLIGASAFVVIPAIPELSRDYQPYTKLSSEMRLRLMIAQFGWTASWLTGWEFMHRYWLPQQVAGRFKGWGWAIIPLIEGVYHLQKSLPEAGLMVVFSTIATPLAIRRRNVLLPFVAHLIIEVAVILYLYR